MTLFLLRFCLDVLANIRSGKFPPASTPLKSNSVFFLVLCALSPHRSAKGHPASPRCATKIKQNLKSTRPL